MDLIAGSLWLCCLCLLAQSGVSLRCSSPTLFAGHSTGMGLQNYDNVCQELNTNVRCSRAQRRSIFRTFDGTCNNNNNLGAAETPLARLIEQPAYNDRKQEPRVLDVSGQTLPSARAVSQVGLPDFSNTSDNTLLLMQWGQFLDHDMTLMPLPTERILEEGGDPLICCGARRRGVVNPLPEDCFPITFRADPEFRGTTCMEFVRTISTNDAKRTRQQINSLTSFIDASSVYGSSVEEEEELREAGGNGFLLKSEPSPQGPLLPRTERAICRREVGDNSQEPVCFIAGDERVNEQPDLATIHTIFLRLHNLIANSMATSSSSLLSSLRAREFNNTVFQSSRRALGAIVQNIMFSEWLPIILGDKAMRDRNLNVDDGRRSQYNPDVDPRILNEFATAAYRMGHSMIPTFLPTPTNSRDINDLRVRLREHFLRPLVVRQRFTALARGLVYVNRTTAREQAQVIDRTISREVSEHLFEPEDENGQRNGFGLDLMSLNIQRGRDHGLQPYNAYRTLFGLGNVTGFGDRNLGANGRRRPLQRAYRSVDDIDLFIGGMSEPPNGAGGLVGETFTAIIGEQMRRLKFGDRFFFTHRGPRGFEFNNNQLSQIRRVTAAMVMCLAVPEISEIQPNAFFEQGTGNTPVACSTLRRDFIRPRDFIAIDN